MLIALSPEGGGQKTKWKTPSPNFEELIESITNMLLLFAGGSRKKKLWGVKVWGGGGGVYALNEFFLKIHNIYEFFFFAT